VLPRLAFLLWLAAAAVSAAGCSRPSPPAPPTFTKDIAPILFTNCAPCHRPGEVGPFSLLSYADAVKHADTIAKETRQRHMPPWLPERGEFPILGERRLTDAQIDAIQRWVKGGTIEGNPADLPKAPTWTAGWQLGPPDAVVQPPRAFTVTPSDDDVYRNLVIRTGLKSGVFVRAVEFKTNGAPIHHAVIRVDRTAASRRRDGEDGQPGFEGMAWNTVQDPGGHFVGWAPGRGPIVAPEGMPWPLEPGADLVVELHVIPSKKPIVIQPTIGLFFSTAPPVQTPVTVKMGSKLIDIPAGASDHPITDTYELPVAVDLLGVYPHAHYLGKDMRVTAAFPDGSSKTLLHIPQWSFHWQQDYRFAAPIPLPTGTKLTMAYTYDNSEGNDENPRHPPVRVRLGPKSTDEMAELGLQVVTKSLADAAKLVQSFDDRDSLANVALGEMRVHDAPESAEERAFLGASLVEVGRFADAIPHLEKAIQLDPKSADAHNDLGNALMALNRLPEALPHFQRAVALDPKNEVCLFNLGNAFKALSRGPEAAAAYQRAIALNPEYPDPRVNLGSMLMTVRRYPEAVEQFQRAAELKPNSAVIHNNLANALGAAGRFGDAMKEVQRALVLNPEYAPAQETLRRLQMLQARQR
jgi:tetratricopeptide (TPR) repeat protein/mono/diheme cytochrome c family protein